MNSECPLLKLVLPLMLGVWLASEFALSLPLCVAVAGLTLVLLFVCLSVPALRRGYRKVLDCLSLLLFCALGVVLVYVNNPYAAYSHYSHWCVNGTPMSVKMRLVETPIEKPKTIGVVAELEQCNDGSGWRETSGRVMLHVAKDSVSRQLRYGDCLEAELKLLAPNGALNPYQFDYRKFLYRKGIAATAYLKTDCYEVVGHQSKGLIGWSKEAQRTLVERLRQTQMKPAYQGLAEALLLGWKQDVDDAMKAQFRDAGIMHLLCVSGLHVGLVTAIIGGCLFLLPRTRWWNLLRILLLLAGTWAFVCLTGMASATVRAGVMFSVYVISSGSGRIGNNLNALAFAALLLLCVNPWCLYDVGFQLSFAAVLGIMLLYHPLFELFSEGLKSHRNVLLKVLSRGAQEIWRLVCLSLSAQLATLPIMMFYFHQFPVYFLIANLLVVPFAGVLLGCVMLVAITMHWGAVGAFCTKVLCGMLGVVDHLTRWVAGLPGAVLENIYCDVPLALLCALWVVMVIVTLRRRQRLWVSMTLFALVAVVGYAVAVDFRCVRNQQLVVYADAPVVAVELFDGKESYLFTEGPLRDAPDALRYQRGGLLLHNKVRTTHVCALDTVLHHRSFEMHRGVLSCKGTKFLVSGKNGWAVCQQDQDFLKVDYLVAGGCKTYELEKLLDRVQCDTVVVGCGGGRWRTDALRRYCADKQIPCRNLRLSGALLK